MNTSNMRTLDIPAPPVETISLTLSGIPRPLVNELDAIAESEDRSRSRQTKLLLEEIIALKKSKAAGKRT